MTHTGTLSIYLLMFYMLEFDPGFIVLILLQIEFITLPVLLRIPGFVTVQKPGEPPSESLTLSHEGFNLHAPSAQSTKQDSIEHCRHACTHVLNIMIQLLHSLCSARCPRASTLSLQGSAIAIWTSINADPASHTAGCSCPGSA